MDLSTRNNQKGGIFHVYVLRRFLLHYWLADTLLAIDTLMVVTYAQSVKLPIS